jgi:hypothetical protein
MIAREEIATDSADHGAERWAAVFHKVNGWMYAPAGAYFRANGQTVELVGGVHRCGSEWYVSSITQRREHV